MTKLMPGPSIVLITVFAICVSMSACKKDICTVNIDNETRKMNISVETGKRFRICLPAQLSTGFSWMVNKKSDNITVLGEPEILEKEPGDEVTGRPEQQVFTLKATSSGKGFIGFLYTQQWQKAAQKDRLVRINITAE